MAGVECKGGPTTLKIVAEENEIAKGTFEGWLIETLEPSDAGKAVCAAGVTERENAMASLSSCSLP